MDVWRRAARKENGSRYYEYLFIYTDDIIAISEDPKRIFDKMNRHFLLKVDSIKESAGYLGASISKHLMDGESHYTWAIGSKEYLIESLRICLEEEVEQYCISLRPIQVRTGYSTNYLREYENKLGRHLDKSTSRSNEKSFRDKIMFPGD